MTGHLAVTEEKAVVNQRKAQLSMAPAVRLPSVQEEGKPLHDAGTVAMTSHKMSLFLHQLKKMVLPGMQC